MSAAVGQPLTSSIRLLASVLRGASWPSIIAFLRSLLVHDRRPVAASALKLDSRKQDWPRGATYAGPIELC